MHIVISANGSPTVRTTKTDRERFCRIEKELKTLADHAPLVVEFREAEEAIAAVNALWEHSDREKNERANPTGSETVTADSSAVDWGDSTSIGEDSVSEGVA